MFYNKESKLDAKRIAETTSPGAQGVGKVLSALFETRRAGVALTLAITIHNDVLNQPLMDAELSILFRQQVKGNHKLSVLQCQCFTPFI